MCKTDGPIVDLLLCFSNSNYYYSSKKRGAKNLVQARPPKLKPKKSPARVRTTKWGPLASLAASVRIPIKGHWTCQELRFRHNVTAVEMEAEKVDLKRANSAMAFTKRRAEFGDQRVSMKLSRMRTVVINREEDGDARPYHVLLILPGQLMEKKKPSASES
ncbi:hypothetical protein MUK42_22032 [Musa troglodytarum]|uniref:Uncharacterized protein n=1 Tax=Musa troglodytarum TaxID=320322 RepID=A0A9E7I1C5_9LILI|nr:hypothetical protein MUK42_22032 [Musa troglodytarum]